MTKAEKMLAELGFERSCQNPAGALETWHNPKENIYVYISTDEKAYIQPFNLDDLLSDKVICAARERLNEAYGIEKDK